MPMNQDTTQQVLSIAVISMVLLISVTVFANFETSANTTFEKDFYEENQSFVNADGANEWEVITLNNPPLVEKSETLYAGSLTATKGDNYTVVNHATGEINVTDWNESTGGDKLFANYTGHGGDGYSEYQATVNNTYSGFDLAAVLPIAIAGVAVLLIVVSAFVGLRNR